MKKRFLSIMMALALMLTLLPTAALAAGDTGERCDSGAECDHFAEIGDLHYDTLAGAVAAVTDDTETTIKLLKNANGDGIKVTTGKKIIFDLNNCTYNIDGTTVGSTGTETNGFQLLKGSTVTFKNGTLTSNKAKILIQNYSNLTLDQVKLDGSQIAEKNYTLSNNCGDVLIKDSTITAPASGYAFDVYFWPDGSYKDGVSVTVENSTINGKIECAEDNDTSQLSGKNNLIITDGSTINGDIDIQAVESVSISDARVNGNITNTDTDGSVLVQGSVVTGVITDTANTMVIIDSTNGDEQPIDRVPTSIVATVGGKNYKTLQAAITAAQENQTVALLRDTKEDITVSNNKKITLDLGTYTLTNANSDTITVEIGSELTIEGSGTVDNKTNARAAIFNNGTVTLNGGTYDRTSETGESADVSGGNSWYTICNHGEMTINAGATVKNTGSFSSMIENGYYSYDDTNPRNGYGDGTNHKNPKLTINNGTFIGGLNSVKNDDGGILVINGGSFSNTTQAAVLNWNEATITGGTFIVESTGVNAVLNGASSTSSTENDMGKLEITGGNFVSPSAPIGNYFTGTTKPVVSGGNFSSSISKDFLAEELKAELYSTSKNSQAPYSYYGSVEDALKDAKAGDTVVDLTALQGTEKYTVTLRYGNGEADTTYTKLAAGTTLALPTPTRTDYRFDGWYVNGTRYTNSYPVSGNVTLVAQWTYVGSSSSSSSDPSYSPILDVSDGGSIKVNPRTPEEDDEVTITVDPDSGYEVDEVTVTDRNGREVKVTAERDGTYTFTQPRGRVTISVTFVREGGSTFFSDVPESFWAYDEIAWAYDNGYVNGTSASAFSPNASISRQQVWMILARLSGADPANMSAAREWAVTNGVSDGTTPGGAVTRQQLVALLYRYATLMGYANDQRADLSAYPDAGTVAGYAVEPMQWSVANSIVGGTSNGTLDPTGTATRAQFAVILYRFWDQVG